MCGFIVFIFCQVEEWCQEHWIMQYVWVEGFMLPSVNMNLGSCGSSMWFWVRVV